jgi:hypothetical protein
MMLVLLSWMAGATVLLQPTTAVALAAKYVASPSTSLGTQFVLDEILHVAIPIDHWKPHDKFTIPPNTAYLYASRVGFTDICSEEPYGDRYYRIWPTGYAFKSCGPLGPPIEHGGFDKYVRQLKVLGDLIAHAARVPDMDRTTGVAGNRVAVIARYACPLRPAPQRFASRIKLHRAGHGSRATITWCHP